MAEPIEAVGDVASCLTLLPGGHPVVAPTGDLDLATARVLDELLSAAAGYSEYVAVDLSGVAFLDCSALGVLMRAHDRARSRGGAVVLVHVKPFFRRILTITRVERHLAVYESAQDAVAVWQRRTGERRRSA